MPSKRHALTLAAALALAPLGLPIPAPAQDRKDGTASPRKDEALDNLLKEIDDARDGRADAPKPQAPKPRAAAKPAAAPEKPKPAANGEVSGKDKDLDSLLEKLGESTDRPEAKPDDRPDGPGGPPPSDDPAPGQGKGSKPEGEAKPDPLTGKSRDLDEHLDELTGHRRKKKKDGGESQGPLGQVVKEMRDVEQRLGQTDTGESTRTKQKQIVKNLETLIEQMRAEQSQSKGKKQQSIAMKPGDKPGDPKSQTPGNTGGNAPNAKPQKPTDKRSLAGAKDAWGHLPPELRQEMENVFREEPLPAREDLIRRYYLSVSKKSLKRGE